jgi:hypothetical protein
MLTQAHPRDGGDCAAPLERVYLVPRWAIRERGKILAVSHQWWCVDAVLSFSGGDMARRRVSADEIGRQWCTSQGDDTGKRLNGRGAGVLDGSSGGIQEW